MPHPGEISLAHRGVLFLDELPEFGTKLLEMLRQPLEDRKLTISRSSGSLTFPANFMLVGALNPCPCGWYGDAVKECTCSLAMVSRYQKRISGPLLDRLDTRSASRCPGWSTRSCRATGWARRWRRYAPGSRQRGRGRHGGSWARGCWRTPTHLHCAQAQVWGRPFGVRDLCTVNEAGQSLLRAAMLQLQMSARAYHCTRSVKLARTIADLAGSERIETVHLALPAPLRSGVLRKAIQFRPRRQV
jgi:magnesium chelatase family protein